MAVVFFVGGAFEKFLIVSTFMLFGETGGEAEIGKLDVAFSVDEDVVGFDVTEIVIRYGARSSRICREER